MANMLPAERVTSYPTTKRASVNKLLTENSVTRVINRLLDSDSYVITNTLANVDYSTDIPVEKWTTDSSLPFEFVIHGYYFAITPEGTKSGLKYLLDKMLFNFSDEAEHTLYARIFIDRTDDDYPELYGQDIILNENYAAIKFYIDAEEAIYPDGSDTGNFVMYDAPLVKYMSNDAETSWGRYVPITSTFKFNSASIRNIDGGEVIL